MTRRASPRMTGSRLILTALAVLLIGAGGWWGTSYAEDTSTTGGSDTSIGVVSPPAGTVTYSDQTALELLATLPVKGKSPRTGYDRDGGFGTAWLDVDGNGCDTRNDILARDLLNIVLEGTCTVLTGTVHEPYTGSSLDFVRGQDTSSLLQIDHVVALSNAWQTGAQQISAEQRVRLANDPLNLLAVDGPSNSQKGDGDAATWLPKAKEYRCAYIARQVSVKAAYSLWVTPAEQAAMSGILASCPEQPALLSTLPAAL